MIAGPGDDDWEARFWNRVERIDEIRGFHDGPPDPGDPYDHADDDDIEPDDA